DVANHSTRCAISSRTSSVPEAEARSGRSFRPGGLTWVDVSNWWSSSSWAGWAFILFGPCSSFGLSVRVSEDRAVGVERQLSAEVGVEDRGVPFHGAGADDSKQPGHRLALVDGVEAATLERCGGAAGLDRRLLGDSVGRTCPAGADIDLGVGDLAAESDELAGGVRDPLDLRVRLLRRCRGVDADDLAGPAPGGLEGGEAGDHSRVGRSRHRAHDDGVEEDAELLLLLGDLIGPAREAETAELVLRGSGRDRVRLPSGLLDLGQGVLPARADADVEARRIEADIGAHDARELDIADLVVARIIPIDPALLHEAGPETEVGGHGRDLAGVVGLVAADRDEGVRARGEDVGDDVLELARLVPAEGETGVDVLALGPHPGPAEGLAQSLQCVH